MDKETKDEFIKVRTEFSEYQNALEKRLDILFEKFERLQKPFTYKEIGLIIIGIISYTYYVTRDFSGVKSMAETTKENDLKQDIQIKEGLKDNANKIDKIYEVVVQTNIDVAVLKGEKKEYSNRKSEIENNKQIIRNWASGSSMK